MGRNSDRNKAFTMYIVFKKGRRGVLRGHGMISMKMDEREREINKEGEKV